MKRISFVVLSLLALNTYAQKTEAISANPVKSESNKTISFDEFVNQNAISFVTLGKKSVDGLNEIEVTTFENVTLKSLNLSALEDKAQYFKVKGSDKLLKVESLYRLRLIYQSQK